MPILASPVALWLRVKLPMNGLRHHLDALAMRSLAAHSMYGGGMATGWSVVYGTEALPLTSTKELLNAPSTFQHVDGDGVVPVASSAAGATTSAAVFSCKPILWLRLVSAHAVCG